MRIEKHSKCDSLELRIVLKLPGFTMLMRTAGCCSTRCVFIDKSLTALLILMLWHLFHVSMAADLPGFCICVLSWGQLWTRTSKNSRSLNGSGSSFPNRLFWSRVLSDSRSPSVPQIKHISPSYPLCSYFQFDVFLTWLKISLESCSQLLVCSCYFNLWL